MPTPMTHSSASLDLEKLSELYEKYAADLQGVRAEQQAFRSTAGPDMKAQLDDLEAEITYLRIREHQPKAVVELGSLHGWSTSWTLRALRDNGHGQLYSYDLNGHAQSRVPADLAAGRWTFTEGDIRSNLDQLPDDIGYLFIDAAHTSWFARWYLAEMLPRVTPGTPVSVHDVFHLRWPLPLSEGRTVLAWLKHSRTPYFTVARAKAPDDHARLLRLRARLGITDSVHSGTDNPMIFF